MVDFATIYMTMSTIAVVTDRPPEPVTYEDKWFKQYLNPPISLGQTLDGTVIASSQRDQLEILASDTKLNVRDLSGAREFSKSKIPRVLLAILEYSNAKPKSYGVNFLLTIDHSNPVEWMRTRVLSTDLSERTGMEIIGGGASMSLKSDSKTWNIKVDIRDGTLLAWDFNASQTIDALPDQTRLLEEMDQLFADVMQFLENLEL